MDYNVPFFPNSLDGSHCVQASYEMILSYFEPEKDYDFDELDALTGKYPRDGSTWAALGHIWLAGKGYDVRYWTLIDWHRFVTEGYNYLLERFGKEVADWQLKHGDIELERQRAQEALLKVPPIKKEPHMQTIIDFLDDGYLLKCSVNSNKLNDKEGYSGHLVVVKGYTEESLVIHDPGPEPLENRHVPFREFEAAWAYPNSSAKELAAIKLKSR